MSAARAISGRSSAPGGRGKGGRSWWRIIATVLMALAVLILAFELYLFAMVVWYNHRPPASTAVMRGELARLQKDNPGATLNYTWVPYEKISPNLARAVVASEDARFLEHDGVEWEAIEKAYEYNQQQLERGRTKMRGGSTITQQVAKNLFLSGSRSYVRKGQELVLTYMIEHVMSKKRILEIYLNIAEWGVGVFGAQAAAEHYYRGDASGLSAQQSARLAAMLPNPRYYDAHRTTRYLNARTDILQRRLGQSDIP